MNPRARRFLRRTFIAAFFIVAPAIILSTAGYSYNFSRQRFERTGVMIVESRPEGGKVSLDGRPQKSQTPARLQKLSPGPYAVRVEKAGYHGWEKTAVVRSRETTFLNHISLFRETAPMLFVEMDTTGGETFSRDARYAASVTETIAGSELSIVDLRDGSEIRPYRAGAEPSALSLSWSRNGRRLLIGLDARSPRRLLWDSSEPESVMDLADETGLPISEAFWAQDSDRLFVAADGALYELDTKLSVVSPVGPAPDEAIVAGGSVYGIKEGSPATLVRRRLRDEEYETVAELPSADFTPLPGRDSKIAYVSTVSERLFIIDPASGRAEAFEGRGRGGAWSSDDRKLLYWSDLELRLYDSSNGQDSLITRLSGPIRQAAWHRPDWNAIYASGNDLFAVETSDDFGRVTVPLAGFEELRAFMPSRNGDYLYAFGSIDGRRGLWRLSLR